MAGGRGNSTHGGNLDRTCQWLCHRRFYASATRKTPSNIRFKECDRTERDQVTLKNLNELQENILRIFTNCLHCDFNIIYDNDIIQTNQCIVRTRSPRFYEALEPCFVCVNGTVNCILNTSVLYDQIKDFIRSLYTNLDVSHKEQLLVTAILNNNYACEYVKQCYTNESSGITERIYKKCLISNYNEKEELARVEGYDADVSPTLSDMADSGLETGSLSPHENTTSEHSSADFEESQTTGYVSNTGHSEKVRDKQVRKRDNKVTVDVHRCEGPNSCSDGWRARDLAESTPTSNEHSATCSLDTDHQQLDSSSSSTENQHKMKMHADEVFHYETQVLSDPFYESDCGSDENESFEIIDPTSVLMNVDAEKTVATSELPSKSENLQVEYPRTENVESNATDISNRTSFNSTSNYYFIDASTLNDEIEILTADVSKRDQHSTDKSEVYSSLPTNNESSSYSVEDQVYKYTAFKPMNLQTGHEKVAEFERELKLTEYLQPLTEPRKIKRVDSIPDDKTEGNKGVEKEALVVEIKEADSGESTQHSPCPDNNSNVNKNNAKAQDIIDNTLHERTNSEKQNVNLNVSETNAKPNEDSRRPSLIRRNTFELDSDDEKLSILRQEYERRQGTLVFQSSIPQYSGHRVDGDSCYDPVSSTESSVTSISNVQNSFIPDVQFSTTVQYHSTSSYLPYEEPKYEAERKQSDNNYLLQMSTGKSTAVYPVTKSASDKVLADLNGFHLHDVSSASSTSLPITLNHTEKENHTDLVKKSKCSEAVPIISGGVSTSDYSKSVDSPMVRRKTESTPIVSGGSVIMSEPEVKPKPPRMSSSLTTWVVDMSDCNKGEQKSSENTQPNMSQSYSVTESTKKSIQKSNEKHNSLGFFINLKDIDSKVENSESKPIQETKQHSDNGKPYCEFYVDISEKSSTSSKLRKKPERDTTNEKMQKSEETNDKKNIFPMYIDLSDPHKTIENTKTSQKKTLQERFADKRTEEKFDELLANKSDNGSQEDESSQAQKSSKNGVKQSVFMFIESDSPVVRRRTLSSSRPGFKRHSWNVDKTQNVSTNGHVAKELMFRREHKRAHSLSVDRNELKMQTKQSSSSHSLSDAARAESLNRKDLQEASTTNNMDTSTEDVFEFDAKDTPPNSHVEIINEKLRVSVKQHEYKELISTEVPEIVEGTEGKVYEDEHSEPSAWDKTCTESTEGQTRKSETFDISSGSGPSPDSDNHDYELSDLLNGEAPNIVERPQIIQPIGNKISETQKSLNETIKKIESELKGPEYEKMTCDKCTTTSLDKNELHSIKESRSDVERSTCSNFVRLSDLDKTPVYETCQMSDIAAVKEDKATYRMSNSIPETSWIESKLVMSRMNGPVRPISRKVPSVMSTSLPPKQKSPLEDLTNDCEAEGIISESDLSSMQSSMGRSGADGSTEETETSSLAGAKPYNRLGEDLLRMFLEEINPDITIDVAGRRIRAHKCILSSRCQYFAAILSGGWIESAGNVISLQGYSYNAVHFALCHIYSGESNIPDSISIVELATLADMLCLEGLKEVIGYTLKVKYCHLFHKPCQICAVGVLECMPLAAAYGLDELYRKSLRWVTRHFVRIWPCKAFATLPRELMEKCYHQHIVHMSTENVLQTIMDCDKLLATLPNVRWAEPVFRMVSNLLETSMKFLSDNFSAILGNENFQSLGRELTWNISRLEDNFLTAAERLPPDQACKSYSKLHKMLASTHLDDSEVKEKWGPLFIDFLKKIQSRVEKSLVRDAPRAARTTSWLKMDLELRRRIQELACLVILPHESPKRSSRHSNFLKGSRAPPSRSTPSRSLDLKRVKMAISEHNDKTSRQTATVQLPRKVFNKPKSDPLERKIQEDKHVNSDSTIRPRSWPNKMEVKSRYLEPRNKPVPKETTQHQPQHEKVIVQQRRKIMISSSDSSRTSSPAMKRATDKKPLAKMKLPVKKDAKALSSDSLTESNTSKTNNRKDLISKSCGITRPESPSFEQKNAEIGLSVDSLAETRNKPTVAKKRINKMDTSMSTDSLMTELTITPKSNVSNKLSPTLNKNNVTKTQVYDRTKKSSPPTQQRSPLTVTRRSPKSLESSTAASRSRAAAISAYHGSPSLRRNLLDAAKAPDIPTKPLNNVVFPRTPSVRPQSTASISSGVRRERKESVASTQGSESPSKKSSPKLSGTSKPIRSTVASRRNPCKPNDEKVKAKCHNGGANAKQQPTVGSRSGTFLKDEPTILKKADMNAAQAST